MASETVKIYVKDQNDDPIVGVLVRVFDAAGATFISQDYTVLDSGRAVADFTLNGGGPISYTIRLSMTGVAFDGALGDSSKSPQLITVYSPPGASPSGTNYFEVVGQTFDIPVAVDPRLCRASGFFRDSAGRPLASLDITIINQFKPALVDGYGVLGSKLDLRTDLDGYAVVDLYRGGEYRALVQSVEAPEASDIGSLIFERHIVVPDRSSVSLIDLLFPIVTNIVWDPTTLTVATGEILDVYPTASCSDGQVLANVACEDVVYTTEDESIAAVSAQWDKIVILGISPGTTNLIATRKDQTIVSIPSVSIVGSPIAITVT